MVGASSFNAAFAEFVGGVVLVGGGEVDGLSAEVPSPPEKAVAAISSTATISTARTATTTTLVFRFPDGRVEGGGGGGGTALIRSIIPGVHRRRNNPSEDVTAVIDSA